MGERGEGEGGSNPCEDGLGHLFREELSRFKWAFTCFAASLIVAVSFKTWGHGSFNKISCIKYSQILSVCTKGTLQSIDAFNN